MPEEPPPLTLDGLAAYITAWGAPVDPTEDAEAASAGWSALEAARRVSASPSRLPANCRRRRRRGGRPGRELRRARRARLPRPRRRPRRGAPRARRRRRSRRSRRRSQRCRVWPAGGAEAAISSAIAGAAPASGGARDARRHIAAAAAARGAGRGARRRRAGREPEARDARRRRPAVAAAARRAAGLPTRRSCSDDAAGEGRDSHRRLRNVTRAKHNRSLGLSPAGARRPGETVGPGSAKHNRRAGCNVQRRRPREVSQEELD